MQGAGNGQTSSRASWRCTRSLSDASAASWVRLSCCALSSCSCVSSLSLLISVAACDAIHAVNVLFAVILVSLLQRHCGYSCPCVFCPLKLMTVTHMIMLSASHLLLHMDLTPHASKTNWLQLPTQVLLSLYAYLCQRLQHTHAVSSSFRGQLIGLVPSLLISVAACDATHLVSFPLRHRCSPPIYRKHSDCRCLCNLILALTSDWVPHSSVSSTSTTGATPATPLQIRSNGFVT